LSAAVLALFAKAPVPGQVKTRLCPPLSPEAAAAGYEAMLRDILDRPPPIADLERVLWFTPGTAADWFAAVAPGYRLEAQRGPDLGRRMQQVFRTHAAEGCERIVLRGTDSPTLPQEIVAGAFAALDAHPLVICPDRDGGYNLIGLREPCDALFELPMSTSQVFEQTVRRARELGLEPYLLPAHHDVDTVEDLRQLELDGSTPRTARWLEGVRDSIRP
jgi:rSAM/selenodomain-associated transferase 1